MKRELMIAGTWWQNIRASVGKPFRSTWFQFCQRFVMPMRVVEKRDLPGWSPTYFAGDRRRLELVTQCFALGLDVDHAGSFGDVCEPWRDGAALIHTTFNHSVDAPRARVVLPLSRGVNGSEYARLWNWAWKRASEAGLVLDSATRDPSRLWFLPGTSLQGDFRAIVHTGPALDVDAVLGAEPPASLAVSVPPVLLPVGGAVDLVERARKYLQRCEPAISGQHGSVRTFVVAQKLVRGFGLSESVAVELLATHYNPRCRPPWSMRDLERKVREAARVGNLPLGFLLQGKT